MTSKIKHMALFKPYTMFFALFACLLGNPIHAQQLSASDAAISAQEFTGGRVLKVKPLQENNLNYRVRVLLPEGKVRNVIVNGNNGEVHFRKNKAIQNSIKSIRKSDHAPINR